ncbi:hypothetical protein CVT24_000149, partial [Panaeolus cyanescens]
LWQPVVSAPPPKANVAVDIDVDGGGFGDAVGDGDSDLVNGVAVDDTYDDGVYSSVPNAHLASGFSAYILFDSSELVASALVAQSVSCNTLLDSGCTHHIVRDRSCFSTYDSSASVNVAVAPGRGDVPIEFACEGVPVHVVLRDCLHAPDIPMNLLSVNAMADDFGLVFEFAPSLTTVRLPAPSTASLSIRRRGRLSLLSCLFVASSSPSPSAIALPAFPLIQDKPLTFTRPKVDSSLWHRRLGHLGQEATRAVLTHNYVEGLEFEGRFKDEVCVPCLVGKGVQGPFAHNGNRASRVGQLLHIDICGQYAVKTPQGYAYFIIILDDKTNFGFVGLLRTRDNALLFYKVVQPYLTRVGGGSVETVRFDGARELCEGQMRKHIESQGTVLQVTAPFAHQQNGKAERFVRVVEEGGAALLADSVFDELRPGRLGIPRSVPPAIDSLVTTNGPDRLTRSASRLVTVAERTKVPIGSILLADVPISPEEAEQLADMERASAIRQQAADLLRTRQELAPFATPSVPDSLLASFMAYDFINRTEPELASAFFDVEEEVLRDACLAGFASEGTSWSLASHSFDLSKPPATYEEMLLRPDRDKWIAACKREIASLKLMGAFVPTNLPPGRKSIRVRWVFAYKRNPDGSIIDGGEKARLVAKGFSQRPKDYGEVSSPVARTSSIRTVMAYAAHEDLELMAMDVKTAFLHAKLDRDIYIEQIPGDPLPHKGMVLKLLVALYGLKQAAYEFYQLIRRVLSDIGMLRCEVDHAVFFGEWLSPPHPSIPMPANGGPLRLIFPIHVDDGVGALLAAKILKNYQ